MKMKRVAKHTTAATLAAALLVGGDIKHLLKEMTAKTLIIATEFRILLAIIW